MLKKTVAVLFGGVTSEHDVSLVSASFVTKNIDLEKYDLKMIGISKVGEWFLYSGTIDNIANNSWLDPNYIKPVTVSLIPQQKGFFVVENNEIKDFFKVDVIFSVIHGRNGEDGTLPALFKIAQIPFVGCDYISSAICMDKELTHILLQNNNIKNTDYVALKNHEFKQIDLDIFASHCEEKLKYPMFVKPANAGSSVGISKAYNRSELFDSIAKAFKIDKKIIIEKFVKGQEVECAVIGNDELFASIPGEIAPANDFYDYDAKYNNANSLLYIPAKISSQIAEQVREIAKKAYSALGCSGMARVDFFVTDNQEIILNEINTIPGFTSISMYPKLLVESGFKPKEITTKLITLALEQHDQNVKYDQIIDNIF